MSKFYIRCLGGPLDNMRLAVNKIQDEIIIPIKQNLITTYKFKGSRHSIENPTEYEWVLDKSKKGEKVRYRREEKVKLSYPDFEVKERLYSFVGKV